VGVDHDHAAGELDREEALSRILVEGASLTLPRLGLHQGDEVLSRIEEPAVAAGPEAWKARVEVIEDHHVPARADREREAPELIAARFLEADGGRVRRSRAVAVEPAQHEIGDPRDPHAFVGEAADDRLLPVQRVDAMEHVPREEAERDRHRGRL
jgi:hypothetical protein